MQMRLVNNETNRSHIASACASLVFVVVAGACALYTAPGVSLRVQKPANFEIVRWVAPHNIVVSENRIMATQSAAASILSPFHGQNPQTWSNAAASQDRANP